MEIVDLSMNETISRRSNHPLLPQSIRELIVGKSVCSKTTLLLIIFYLDQNGSITIIFAYSEKAFFNPNTEY